MTERAVRRRARVHGHVQGVGFRYWVVEQADLLGVRGTVSNRPDGTVECVVEGAEAAVAALVELLHRGPWSARVDRVDLADEPEGTPLPSMMMTA